MQLDEVVKGIQGFLDGHHQVTYAGKHGDFHIYSVVHLHTEGRTPDPSPEMMEHHKKIHTLEEYHRARRNTNIATYGQEGYPGPPPENPQPTDKHFVTDSMLALGSSTRDVLQDSAVLATRRLRAAGLPSSTRHVVAIDQSKQVNQNTGVEGGVGGHWDKKNHVVAVNRATIHATGNAMRNTTGTLVHEWAHGFHDQMSKPQKAAWRSFYEKHVAGAVISKGTEEDKNRYVQEFHDAYMQHPAVKNFQRQLQARENTRPDRLGARMHQSIHLSNPDWWRGMLDDGHLSKDKAGTGGAHGVVAQTSHTLHGYSDPEDRSTRKAIRKNSLVHVRSLDPNDPTDRAHMARNLFDPGEHHRLLAVSPVGKPHHVAIVDRLNLKYTPTDGAPKVGTHLRYDHEKTRDMYHAAFVKDAKEEMASRGSTMPDHEKYITQSAIDLKPEDFSHHGFSRIMSDRYKNEVELGGSEHKTVRDYVQHIKSRGAINLSNAVYDTHTKLARSHPKIHNPGGGPDTMERITGGILRNLGDGMDHAKAVTNAVRYNVEIRTSASDLVGADHHNDREAAAGQQRTFSSYGASNDKELFATTVEHMATINVNANRANLPPHQRKLVQAWRNVVHGATTLERIVDVVGHRFVTR